MYHVQTENQAMTTSLISDNDSCPFMSQTVASENHHTYERQADPSTHPKPVSALKHLRSQQPAPASPQAVSLVAPLNILFPLHIQVYRMLAWTQHMCVVRHQPSLNLDLICLLPIVN